MTSIFTNILSSTVGLLWNKARDATASNLKDGDITDEKVREIIVRELNDINTKIDGLSRKDLLSSYRFLKEGVDLLNVSLDKSTKEQEGVINEAEEGRAESLKMPSGVESGIMTEALELSHAMGKSKLISNNEFQSAKKRFECARKKATEGFCNEALRIKDRIFAAKLRVVSEILECLEFPETAITGCLSFLQGLHSLPAIREMFSVYLSGGLKSMLNKAERAENIESVMLVNYVLFQFISNFSRKFSSVLSWPAIELFDRSFNPILNWREVSKRKSWRNELTQPPNGLSLDKGRYPFYSALNSHGETVVRSGDNMKVISKTGEIEVVKLPDAREGEIICRRRIMGLAIDNNNNIYVVGRCETRTKDGIVNYKLLYVLDEKYNIKHDCRLDFLDADYDFVGTAINKSNNIIMITIGDQRKVYVCHKAGQLKHTFKLNSGFVPGLSVSDKNEIMIPSSDQRAVHFYTETGDLLSEINVPQGHWVCGMAIHSVTRRMIVLTNSFCKRSYFLLFYSETGELQITTFLYKWSDHDDSRAHSIISHPSGPVAVVSHRSVTFI